MSSKNNFNLLRLFFAWLVIVSHSFELLDGNRSREPLTVVFGTLSFGELAVDAFFILSGYLISQSWLTTPSPSRFLIRRVMRIVPGFIVCILISIAAYAVIFDPEYLSAIWWSGLMRSLLVLKVDLPDVFPGSHYPSLNGALWTIHFEFFCYIGILLLGVFGILRRKFVTPAWISLLVIYMIFIGVPQWSSGLQKHMYLVKWLRLSGCYLSGVVWYLYSAQIQIWAKKYIVFILPAFVYFISVPVLSVCAIGIFFPLLLSYCAYSVKVLNGFWLRDDISYGIYLYAWPVQKIIIASLPGVQNPWSLVILTSLIAAALGWLSWVVVERPSIHFVRYFERTRLKFA